MDPVVQKMDRADPADKYHQSQSLLSYRMDSAQYRLSNWNLILSLLDARLKKRHLFLSEFLF